MIGKVLVVVLTVLVFQNVECENDPPPVMTGSFIAWGEIVQPLPDTDDEAFIQVDFEECFDSNTKNAAFFLRLLGKNATFVKNYATNQTLLYVEENDDDGIKCSESAEVEWLESDLAPALPAFQDDDGRVKFSLSQLLSLPDKYLMDAYKGVVDEYRGIPSKSWTYEIKSKKTEDDTRNATSLIITSYWSQDTWNTTAGQKVTPLGFNVSKITWSQPVNVEDYVVNVYGFVPNAYDHKYFEPYEGVICPARKRSLKFPDVKNIKAISLHSEMALPDYQELRYIDMWFDPRSQLIRIDLERLKDENPVEKKKKHYQSEVAIGKLGVVFRWSYYKGEAGCEVIPFSKYENDFQNLFDIKQDLKNWKMGKIFGLNDTSYVYIGKTTKNDIPCHLFQGVRNDWPDKKAGIESLWEWCFNVNMTKDNDIVMFEDEEFGLVSANIIIQSAASNMAFNGYRMNHHFYEVKEQDPKILDATSFDIERCYKDTQRRALQFYLTLDIGEDNRHLAENATSDVSFLQKWKAAIYKHSGLEDYSLRVSGVRATIDDSKVYIKFFLLDVHEDLPSDMKDKQLSTNEAEANLRNNINAEKVSIAHAWSKETTTLQAAKQSLSLQIDPNFQPQTLPPLPSTITTESTLFPFTLIIDPTPSNKPVKTTGHGPGSVAGVSIALLLIGMTLGSAGTFFKINGFPQCGRR